MPTVFDTFYALGFDGIPLPVFWKTLATKHVLPGISVLDKYKYKLLNARSLVVLHWTLNFNQPDMDALLKTGASVFAHIPSGRDLHPHVVIDNVLKRLKDCCSQEFLHGPSSDREHALLDQRLARLLEGRPPYDRIPLSRPDNHLEVPNPRSVFLASPFEEQLYRPFHDGVHAAMDALGIQILNPGDRHGTATVNHDVRSHLDRCDFMIANLRNRTPNDERSQSANVWYEIGYAWKSKKPVLLFSQIDDQFEMPSDIRGVKYSTYSDAIHLALQLFYGFGGHATTPSLS